MVSNEKLRAIGFRITAPDSTRKVSSRTSADIESTLLEAIQDAPQDGRLASLIFTWLQVHGAYVNVERFAKLARSIEAPLVRGYAAFAAEHCGAKWSKLARRSKEPVYLYPQELTESAVRLKGANELLKKVNVIVPSDAIRIRERDVFTPQELAHISRQYRNRYLYGPSWRADIITAIESGAASPSEVMRMVGCSYEPAHRVFREYKLAREAA